MKERIAKVLIHSKGTFIELNKPIRGLKGEKGKKFMNLIRRKIVKTGFIPTFPFVFMPRLFDKPTVELEITEQELKEHVFKPKWAIIREAFLKASSE